MRICVTGPECAGKTTLAGRLAASLGTVWVPEAARLYADRSPRVLTLGDVEPIAREHIALADAAAHAHSKSRAIVLDTDLISTVVYSRHYYGETSPWLERVAHERLAALYLLCDVDVPWEADGIRDRPHDREAMFALFSAELARQHARVVIIRGGWTVRWKLAKGAVEGMRLS